MTPITKNIDVVDLQGNYHAPTYKRRAKGLVKSGRARWSDEYKICLLDSPAHLFEEDNTMDRYDNDGNVVGTGKKDAQMTVAYILQQMETIRDDNKHILEAIIRVSDIQPYEPNDSGAVDVASQAKAHAIADIVKSREKTNQKMLDMYEKVYNDIRPSSGQSSDKVKALELAAKMAEDSEEVGEILADYIGKYLLSN